MYCQFIAVHCKAVLLLDKLDTMKSQCDLKIAMIGSSAYKSLLCSSA
jgi:hypothetical protein